MKKLTSSLAMLACLAFASSTQAQTIKTKVKTKPAATTAAPTTATAGTTAATANLNDYAGTYAVENLPFEEMSFYVKEGKLWVKAGDNDGAVKTMPEPDTFDGGQAIFHFKRDENKKVTGMAMEAAGITFEGTKK